MMRLGMRMYNIPELRLTQNCTECGEPLNDSDVGTPEEMSAQIQAGCLGEPKTAERFTCPKCGRTTHKIGDSNDDN